MALAMDPPHPTPAFMEMREKMLAQREAAKEAGAAMFMGVPDAWYANPLWRCENGHISRRYLKSEALGGAVCLDCYRFVMLTHPGDTEDGPLAALPKDGAP